jgi:PIN domain nuclease of toxin-antitoxin system
MMYLLDTTRLSIELRRDIGSAHADVFVSIARLWEIAVKAALKKLDVPANPGTYALLQLKRQRFKLLNVDAPHIDAVRKLPDNS